MTLNFFIADVQNGMGAFVALYLMAGVGWNAAQIGTVLAVGGIAQVLAQTPAGALIDELRQKRALIVIGAVRSSSAACPSRFWAPFLWSPRARR